MAESRLQKSRDDLDQSGLSCAVIAHDGDDLLALDGQIHRFQRLDEAELHTDVLQPQQRRCARIPHGVFLYHSSWYRSLADVIANRELDGA